MWHWVVARKGVSVGDRDHVVPLPREVRHVVRRAAQGHEHARARRRALEQVAPERDDGGVRDAADVPRGGRVLEPRLPLGAPALQPVGGRVFTRRRGHSSGREAERRRGYNNESPHRLHKPPQDAIPDLNHDPNLAHPIGREK